MDENNNNNKDAALAEPPLHATRGDLSLADGDSGGLPLDSRRQLSATHPITNGVGESPRHATHVGDAPAEAVGDKETGAGAGVGDGPSLNSGTRGSLSLDSRVGDGLSLGHRGFGSLSLDVRSSDGLLLDEGLQPNAAQPIGNGVRVSKTPPLPSLLNVALSSSPTPAMGVAAAPSPRSSGSSDYDFVTESDSDDGDGVETETPLDGRYLLVKKIGEGATASANLCLDLAEGNRPVILKNTDKRKFRALPKPDQSLLQVDGAAAAALAGPMAEIAVLKKLSHVNVIRLYEVVDDPASITVSLVLEYANGGDLGYQIALTNAAAAAASGSSRGGVHPKRLWSWCRDIVSGLAYMHKQGVLHRDIKPDNILLDTGNNAKIADFGASVIIAEGGNDRVTDIAGTPSYMAPECVRGDSYGGFAADVWSLGMTMYHCLFGCPAFSADNTVQLFRVIEQTPVDFPEERMEDLHVELRQLLRRCLDRDPAKRITLPEMLQDSWLTRDGASQLTRWSRFSRIRVSESDVRDAVQVMETSTKLMGESTQREERVLATGDVLTRQGDVATEAYFVLEGTADTFLETSVEMRSLGKASEKRKVQSVVAGEFIGEVALFLDELTARTASVVATSAMRVTVIKKHEIEAFFTKDPEAAARIKEKANQKQEQRRRLAHLLKNQLELKLGMGLAELPTLSEQLPWKQCKTGSIITSQGDRGDMVWFIKKGAAKIVYMLPGKKVEDAIVLIDIKEGDFIGMMAIILDEERRLVSSVATAPSELIGIRRHLFLQLVGGNPALEAKMRSRARQLKQEREELIADKMRQLSLTIVTLSRARSSFRRLQRDSSARVQALSDALSEEPEL